MAPTFALKSYGRSAMTRLIYKSRSGYWVQPGHRSLVTESFFEQEKSMKPFVHTADIPGPRAKEMMRSLGRIFDTSAAALMCDYKGSFGNFLADVDGNLFLDVYAQIASIPVGYSNPNLIRQAVSDRMANALVNRPAMGPYPGSDWEETLLQSVMSVAPPGMNQVFTALAGSDANETAYKAAFIWKRQMQRGHDTDFSTEELESCMENRAPGSPELAIMSFEHGFHGRLFGSLSTTRSKPIHKLDIPAFKWPKAPFPMLKYPLEENISANKLEEEACLAEVERLLKDWHCPIAAVIVEPVQSEGGDNHASANFFKELRRITEDLEVLLIVDEVQTGVGATGKFWAHEHWALGTSPDMVTFSKKAQTAGYYYGNPNLRPSKPYRQFNTWMGDQARMILFSAIIDEIKRLDLIEHTRQTGASLAKKLKDLASRYPTHMQNLRGLDKGTFIAWDSPERESFIRSLQKKGINIGVSGERAVRLRPMLIFTESHAHMLVSAMEDTFRES